MADTRTCENCGKSFIPKYKPSPNRLTRGRFCSKDCGGRGQLGSKNANWHGGRHKSSKGYVLVYTPSHPNAQAEGYVFEHRLVMEARLGRYLRSDEHIHHINGNRSDNQIKNLEVLNKDVHHARHASARKGKPVKWSAEQVAEAVALSNDVGLRSASRLLNIPLTTLYRWR